MPNLLPDWLPWIRPAGRLIWGVLALIFGLMFLVALMKRPLLKRPFPDRVGYAAFSVIVAVGVVAAKVLSDYQTLVVWATALALAGHGLLMVASSKGRDPEEPATWAECFAGAVGVFALFVVGFAIIPSEWLNYANSYLNWVTRRSSCCTATSRCSSSRGTGRSTSTIPPFVTRSPS